MCRLSRRASGTRARTGELLSEGTVPPALQVRPSGRLTLFLVDHPVTTSFPVIAVLRTADVPRASEARPASAARSVSSQQAARVSAARRPP